MSNPTEPKIMLHDTGIIYMQGGYDDGPLCPRSMGAPVEPLHAAAVRFQDLAWKAAPKDADDEVDESVAGVVNAVSYGFGASNRMRLYRDATTASMPGWRQVVVESWYFQCHACGLILPAQAVRDSA